MKSKGENSTVGENKEKLLYSHLCLTIIIGNILVFFHNNKITQHFTIDALLYWMECSIILCLKPSRCLVCLFLSLRRLQIFPYRAYRYQLSWRGGSLGGGGFQVICPETMFAQQAHSFNLDFPFEEICGKTNAISSLVLKVHWHSKAANILVYVCLGELRHQGAFVSLSIPSMKGLQGVVREEGLDLEMSCLV